MAKKIGFKSYCWAIGTTSYRTDNFNLTIAFTEAIQRVGRK